MKPTIHSVAADIARRVPAMKTDSSLNNEQLIAGMIEPLLDAESDDDEAAQFTKFFYLGVVLGFITAAVFATVVAILK